VCHRFDVRLQPYAFQPSKIVELRLFGWDVAEVVATDFLISASPYFLIHPGGEFPTESAGRQERIASSESDSAHCSTRRLTTKATAYVLTSTSWLCQLGLAPFDHLLRNTRKGHQLESKGSSLLLQTNELAVVGPSFHNREDTLIIRLPRRDDVVENPGELVSGSRNGRWSTEPGSHSAEEVPRYDWLR